MSVSGVSSFSPFSAQDLRAEFERQREIHSKGPAGYEKRRRVEETEPRPSVGASALAAPEEAKPNALHSAAMQKVNFSV